MFRTTNWCSPEEPGRSVARAALILADPDGFGYDANELGMSVVQNYLVHDLAARNKAEFLIWDRWGLCERHPGEDVTAEEEALLDRVAALSLSGDDAFQDIRAIYEGNARLRLPARLTGPAGRVHSI